MPQPSKRVACLQRADGVEETCTRKPLQLPAVIHTQAIHMVRRQPILPRQLIQPSQRHRSRVLARQAFLLFLPALFPERYGRINGVSERL